jgi:hypothetical protein
MDIESLFSESKWDIISSLAHDDLSPSQLADITKTSPANISTQLRLLQAMDIVESERLNNVGKGEARKQYSLKKDFAYLVLASKTSVGKKLIRLDGDIAPFFIFWMITDSKTTLELMKYYCKHEKTLKKCDAWGYLGKHEDKYELLVIHKEPEKIKHTLNKENFFIRVHHLDEVKHGLEKNDDYFISLVKRVSIVFDNVELIKLKKRK